MDSPAARLQRVLIGIAIPAAFLTALALAEGRIELIGCEGDACNSTSEIAMVLPGIVLPVSYTHLTLPTILLV